MNKDYTIISKGNYTHKQTSEFLQVNRFIVIRKKTGRYLLLELNNLHKDVLTSVSFQIDQIDARGNSLGSVNATLNDLSVENGKFVLKEGIKLHRACLDVRVIVLKAKYGDLVYNLGNNETFAIIEKKEKREPINRKKVEKEVGEEGHVSKVRRFKNPLFMGVFLLLLVVICSGIIFLQLQDFSKNKDFHLSNVEYAFVDGDSSKGSDVYVTGFVGLGGENVKIPAKVDGHPVIAIAEKAFKGNDVMQTLTIEANLEIADSAFENCSKLYEVKLNGVSTIGERAFAGCENLKKVKATKLTNIGNGAFADCVSLNNVVIEDTNEENTLNIGEEVFFGCGEINTFKINQFIAYGQSPAILKGVSGVENLYLKNFNYKDYDQVVNSDKPLSALFGVVGQGVYLSKVEIDYMDYIPANFAQDVKFYLTKFAINNLLLETIGENAFAECEGLSAFVTPIQMISVGNNAFKNCAITSFDMSKVSTLGVGAFYGCEELETVITTSETPLTIIPENAFRDCMSLSKFVVSNSVLEIQKCAFQNSGITEITFAENNLLTTINESVFEGCVKLLNIQLPQSVKTIESKAFSDCNLLNFVFLPDELTSIGSFAFANCGGITNLTIPSSVTSIGIGAIASCDSIKSLSVPFIGDRLESPQETKLGYFFVNPDEYDQVITPIENNADVPDSLRTLTIIKGIEIGSGALKDCANITTINLPNTIKQIYSEAFSGCSGIKEITLPSDLMVIETKAFFGCENLRSLTIPSNVWNISYDAFEECFRLYEVIELCVMSTDAVKDRFPYAIGVYGSNQDALNAQKIMADGYVLLKAMQDTSRYTRDTWYLIGHKAKSDIVLPEIPNITTYTLPERYFYNDSSIESVTIPSQVAEIGASQFANSSNLNKVIFKEGGKLKLNGYIFSNCQNLEVIDMLGRNVSAYGFDSSNITNCISLKEVKLPYGMSYLDKWFFSASYTLVSVEMPSTLTSVQEGTFEHFNFLKTVVMPGVTNIPSNMFNGCSALELVSAPNSITIGDSAFNGCWKLKTVEVDNVGHVGNRAFYRCISLENLNLALIEEIQSFAFEDCQSLKSINSQNRLTFIGDRAFYGCVNLTSIQLNNVTSIGTNAFYGCSKLENVVLSNDLQIIPSFAFKGCESITYISIPSSVKLIAEGAFNGCSKLSNIVFEYGYNDLTIADGTYGDSYVFGNTAIIDFISNGRIYKLGKNAFNGNTTLKSVLIEDATEIGSNAFYNCSALTSINLINVDSLGSYVFSNCASLKVATLENVKTLSSNAFSYDIKLVGLVMFGTESIGNYAFEGCSSLVSVDLANVNTIGASAFLDCYSLKTISLSDINTLGSGAFINCSSLREANLNYIQTLGSSAFNGCVELREVNIDNVKTIEYDVFRNCPSLQTATISNVENIGNSAFYGCSALNNLTITNVQNINSYAFTECRALNSLDLSGVNVIGSYCFDSCRGLETISLSNITTIGNNAFRGCTSLREANILNVGTMGTTLFYNCSSLRNVYIENVTTIGENAFLYCSKLQTATIKNVNKIGSHAFEGCSSLNSVSLTNVENVGDYAFNNCYKLATATFSDVNNIGAYAFSNCSSLKNLTLTGAENIGNGTFYQCTGLTDVDLTNTMMIGESAFYNAYSIKTLNITGVNYIRANAFANCASLESLTLPSTLSSYNAIADHSFAYCEKLEVVYIPYIYYSTSNLINQSAFVGCYNLHEVYNYSYISLTPGQTSNVLGNVAYYALVINNSASVDRLQKTTINDIVYKYNDYQAWIVSYVGSNDKVTLGNNVKLGSTTFDSYNIAKYAFPYMSIVYLNEGVRVIDEYAFAGVSSLVLHNGYTTDISEYAFSYYNVNCYFMGTNSEYSGKNYSTYLFSRVYYYVDCVHSNYNEWTERDGQIITTRSYVYKLIKDATCTEEGYSIYYCKYCDHTYSENVINELGHSISTNYYHCTRCDHFNTIYISSNNYSSYPIKKVLNMELTNFTAQNNMFQTVNVSSGSVATMTITAQRDMSITLQYALFDSTGNESLTIVGGGQNIVVEESGQGVGINGSSQKIATINIDAGEKLVITFNIDGQEDSTAFAIISTIIISAI